MIGFLNSIGLYTKRQYDFLIDRLSKAGIRIDELEEENVGLRMENRGLKMENGELRMENGELKKEIEKLKLKIAKTKRRKI